MDLLTLLIWNTIFLAVVFVILFVIALAMPARPRRRLMIQPAREDLRRIKEEIEEEVIEESMPFKPLKKSSSKEDLREAVI